MGSTPNDRRLFVWKLPNDPPDPAALERMRVHFLKPTEPMPYAWFMGDIDFFTELIEASPESLDCQIMMRPLHELTAGLVLFPMAEYYVPIWKDWYKFMLPYALSTPDIPTVDGTLQGNLLAGCITLYPHGITEEYPGFRDDLVYSLGIRAIPILIARDDPGLKDELQNPLFNDIWYFVNSGGMEYPGRFEEFSLPMLFCLKYLRPEEIDPWVESLIAIDSPQWWLAIITWWLDFNHFLELAADWPGDGNIRTLIETFFTGKVIKHQPFASLNDWIPLQNLDALRKALTQHVTVDVFRVLAADI